MGDNNGVKARKKDNKDKEAERDHYICTDTFLIGYFFFPGIFSHFILNSCHTTMVYFVVVVAVEI